MLVIHKKLNKHPLVDPFFLRRTVCFRNEKRKEQKRFVDREKRKFCIFFEFVKRDKPIFMTNEKWQIVSLVDCCVNGKINKCVRPFRFPPDTQIESHRYCLSVEICKWIPKNKHFDISFPFPFTRRLIKIRSTSILVSFRRLTWHEKYAIIPWTSSNERKVTLTADKKHSVVGNA